MYIKVGNLVWDKPENFIGRLVSIDGENVVLRAFDGEEHQSVVSKLKQVVHYDRSASFHIQKGERASVVAIDHPNPSIFAREFVSTSVVESSNTFTGFFETKNTLYVADVVFGDKSPYLP